MGLDEFLDSVTVLPPGEWDRNIRIEPPTSVPSQVYTYPALYHVRSVPSHLLYLPDLYTSTSSVPAYFFFTCITFLFHLISTFLSGKYNRQPVCQEKRRGGPPANGLPRVPSGAPGDNNQNNFPAADVAKVQGVH